MEKENSILQQRQADEGDDQTAFFGHGIYFKLLKEIQHSDSV